MITYVIDTHSYHFYWRPQAPLGQLQENTIDAVI